MIRGSRGVCMQKKKIYIEFASSASIWKKEALKYGNRRRLLVLLAGITLGSLLLAVTANGLLARTRFIALTRALEILVENEFLGIADEAIGPLLEYDRRDARLRLLVANLARSFVDSGTEEQARYDYEGALDSFRRACALAPSDSLVKLVGDMEYSLTVPKLFIDGVPFDASLTKNGEKWERSFCRIPIVIGYKPSEHLSPGNVLRLRMMTMDRLEGFELRLSDDKGKRILSNRGFVSGGPGSSFSWYCLLGLPATLGARDYILSGKCDLATGSVIGFSERVTVTRRLFPEETIVLNPKLTSLVSVPNEQKRIERLLVAEILDSFHPENVFQEEPFTSPAKDCFKRVSSAFGERRVFRYASGGGYTSIHDGIDFGLVTGTPVFAVGRGKVVLARKHIVSGNTIIIEHLPSVFSVYYHLSKIITKEGEMVDQGIQIGEVGSTGLSTAAHLHLSVFAGKVAVDPEYFMKNRLLF
jgi:hypothetical protein